MNKNIITLGIIALALIALGVGVTMQKNANTKNTSQNSTVTPQQDSSQDVKKAPVISDDQKLKEQVVPQGAGKVANATYTITPSSRIEWEGKKTLLANYIDKGVLMVKEGKAVVSNGVITSGEVIFDMNTINALATAKQTGQDMLSKHLKSDAFFDVEKYPTSTFVFKKAVQKEDSNDLFTYTLTGDLTIKGITHPVTLPAHIYAKDGEVHVDAVATLDRTKWDIRFGSGKFFKDLADNVIDDYFTVTFSLIAYQVSETPQLSNMPSSTPPQLSPTNLPPEIKLQQEK